MTDHSLPLEWAEMDPLRQAAWLDGVLTRRQLYHAIARGAAFAPREVDANPRLNKHELAMIVAILCAATPEPDTALIWGGEPGVQAADHPQDQPDGETRRSRPRK